ncbi:MAG: D-alanine--D-alanine ligase A [Deltaproteobacteria bacterium CG11_big_fil_rev_8_21_14_0_20_45_16]|nr:MAG: D-alanine--D-alanine ligase A [Deltaproteobacteria bacterium CG11_big_fil_rev_8_21_14_0_20_45_16]
MEKVIRTKVLFLCGGISGEHEISLISCKHILKAINRSEFELGLIVIDKARRMLWVDESELHKISDNPKNVKTPLGQEMLFQAYASQTRGPGFYSADFQTFFEPDVIFPILHGVGGEDGSIQGFIQSAGIPYVGASVKAASLAMDKAMTKAVCMEADIPVVPFHIVRAGDKLENPFGYPCFVKPSEEGSSLGVSRVKSEADLKVAYDEALKFGGKILIEPAIVGREIEIAVFDDGKEFLASPAGEIRCLKSDFYSYDAKYVHADAAELIIPATLKDQELKEIQSLAKRIFRTLDCRGLARVDFFMDANGTFLLNEINSMPGFTPISMYPKLMALAGLDYASLLSRLIHAARSGDSK